MRMLTDSEQFTIANALRVAADVYAADAVRNPILQHTFRKQREAALRLAEAFENANAVTINE